jgi:hypothetical protein
MQFCRRGAKPLLSCWVSETGARTATNACEPAGERQKDFACMHDTLVRLNHTYKIERAYLWAWSGTVPAHIPLSVFRSGALCGEATVFFNGQK